ncbi:ABC transporter ATP-binding protein [Nonomuraea sp. NPDC050310]|uniref:ABC transporter ATP-binding protein n=1 Tax=Nonomuraea sp. NPDC050310 TaxID=3154935 RepID=UPI0033F16FE0
MTQVVLACEGLSKRFGDRVAVAELSFTIAEGETYGLLGPNGAGKTTAISMIVGIMRPDAGVVRVDGVVHSVRNTAVKAVIGYVPQELGCYPELSARENLRFFARLYGLRGRSRVEEVLRVVGLEARADEPVSGFSGGMARRLNIGIGLLNHPRLLVLDEPTAGVDPQSRNAILDSVGRLAGEGVAVLYTTHYLEEAERLCDRVGILDEGRLRAEGTKEELTGLVGEPDLESVFLQLTGRELRD